MLKNGPILAYFSVYFRLFIMSQLKFKFKLIKVYIVHLGFEPGAAGCEALTNPLSGIPLEYILARKYHFEGTIIITNFAET